MGPLIAAAAVLASVFGAGTYLVQLPDAETSTVAVSLRTHDEVVFWPNHAAIQRAAVASVNNANGQQAIRAALDQPDLLISVEATALGDPASVEVRATAATEQLATQAAVVAGELAVAEAIEERSVPLLAEVRSISQELPLVIAERDELLRSAIEDDLTTSERVLVSTNGESAAGVVSVFEADLARLEAALAAQKAPLVLIDNPQEVDVTQSALQSSLAAALGVFLVSLLAFSLFRQPKESAQDTSHRIDLTDPEIELSEQRSSAAPRPVAVE